MKMIISNAQINRINHNQILDYINELSLIVMENENKLNSEFDMVHSEIKKFIILFHSVDIVMSDIIEQIIFLCFKNKLDFESFDSNKSIKEIITYPDRNEEDKLFFIQTFFKSIYST